MLPIDKEEELEDTPPEEEAPAEEVPLVE